MTEEEKENFLKNWNPLPKRRFRCGGVIKDKKTDKGQKQKDKITHYHLRSKHG